MLCVCVLCQLLNCMSLKSAILACLLLMFVAQFMSSVYGSLGGAILFCVVSVCSQRIQNVIVHHGH